jgi:hypothetical protein
VAILDDLKAYLGPTAAKYSDAVLTGVITTESAAQASKVNYPPSPAPELAEALMRRCQRNLALRALPIGLTDVQGDADTRSYVPGRDPEIQRLEGPYRKLVLG